MLSDFHKYLDNKPLIDEPVVIENDVSFDMKDVDHSDEDTYPEEFEEKYLPIFHTDIYKPDLSIEDASKKVEKKPKVEASVPISEQPKEKLDDKSNVAKKKGGKKTKNGIVDKCAEKLLKKDKEEGKVELCELCGLSFTNSNEYKKHVRNHKDRGKSVLDSLNF